ncbi:unnamed protein product [Rotaria socialis]|uniref:Uncharacterized protein n=2 Tax=Rotaria socialis TaxID=392032 RepID=A0A820G4R5_9BILA|nr:unnamed protein product [Rotaria socialis]CAF3379820.1 unnamed protein product [Rotaria socialis]CAF3390484.1 unnamed protein product [Rotaria socialis]CAF3447933.1 unnamed protein product [Rotaria socialis]CAF3463155.1 unnamed protein product [Rotaria socialis]
MSYGTSLLASYPLSYDLSTLASDDLVQRSSFGTFYEPSASYSTSGRLLSDELAYGNQGGLGSTSYHSSIYSHLPSTNYRTSSITDWRRDILPQNSYTALNHIREYTESLETSSNTNRTSSVTRSINDNNINGPLSIYPNYQQNYHLPYNDSNRSPRINTIWSPLRTKIHTHDENLTSTHRIISEYSTANARKTPPIEVAKTERTSAPSAPTPFALTRQESHHHTYPPSTDTEKHHSFANAETSSNEKKDETLTDEKNDEQAWTTKIDKLHTIKAQREKDKAKSTRALPVLPKKNDNKPIINKSTVVAQDNSAREASFQMRSGAYFDSLFDGNFFRKSSTNQQQLSPSHQRTLALRNKPHSNSFNKPRTTIFPKYVPPSRAPQYEPPTVSSTATTITSSITKKQQGSKQNHHDSVTPRENIHKDTDERYREALTKFRTDRAEQQQKDTNESTAKRLTYGDYVRRLTKDDLLQTAIKPSPWSDFIDLKKGHLLSLTREEKKELYNQSKSYGERVRFRNFTMHYGPKMVPAQYRAHFWPTQNRESPSSDESNDDDDNNDSKSLKRSDSSSTVKTTARTFTKPAVNNETTTDNQSSPTQNHTDQSSTIQESDDEDDADVETSDFDSSRKQKRNNRFKKTAPTTSGTEETENEDTSEEQRFRTKNRDTDDELLTVMEEKTLESFEGSRYKKR